MKTISLTIPMDCNALTRSAEMLTGLAADISGRTEGQVDEGLRFADKLARSNLPDVGDKRTSAQKVEDHFAERERSGLYPAETPEGQFVEGLSFADKLTRFNETAAEKIAALGTAAKAETPEEMHFAVKRDDLDFQEPPHEKTPAEVFKPVIIDEISDFNGVPDDIIKRWNGALDGTRVHDEVILSRVADDEAETARVLAEMEGGLVLREEGVEIDGDHLPWDHRIHASSKAKLSKAPNCWKRKRNMDPKVIAEVEAELRAAMSAGPDKPVAPAPAKPAVPAEPATPAPAAPTDSTVATFPELMAAITAGGITPAAVQAALNLQGITSLPLLASRPDLIPAVAETLGL
jgi:hypothetical protein